MRKLSKQRLDSNYEIVKNTIESYPGLRFHQIKKETSLANGTLQHHINRLIKSKDIIAIYDKTIPRYFEPKINSMSFSGMNVQCFRTTSKDC